MKEREKQSYVAEIAGDDAGQFITVAVDLENVDREKAENIFCEMENIKEKIKNIMAG